MFMFFICSFSAQATVLIQKQWGMQGYNARKVNSVAYTLRIYWNQFSLGGICFIILMIHIIVFYCQYILLIFYVKDGSHVRNSTLQYKRCVHLWNNFPCIISLGEMYHFSKFVQIIQVFDKIKIYRV